MAIGIQANITADKKSLRMALRDATAIAHDRLDLSMRSAAGWESRADYARFLSLQYQARLSVEMWLIKHAPVRLAPPAQTPLIACDLIALGDPLPFSPSRFRLPTTGNAISDGHALGVAWVLAGSALGNRAILKELAVNGRGNWPTAFLGDPKMLAFWKCIRPLLEEGGAALTTDHAIEAAVSVFDHFQSQIPLPSQHDHSMKALAL